MSLGKVSGWIIDSVNYHTISNSKYNPLTGSSNVKLLKDLDHPKKGLINIQNIDDNKCCKQSIVRYRNPADLNPEGITKADKEFTKKRDFQDIQFTAKIREICKVESKNSIYILHQYFCYENIEKHHIYMYIYIYIYIYQKNVKNVVKKSMLIYC